MPKEKPIDAFVEEGREIELSNGERITIPKLAWGKELKIYKLLSEVMEKALPEDASPDQPISPKAAMRLLTEFGDVMSKIAALFLGKDEEWVEENLSAEDMINVILPLSLKTFRKISDGMTNALGR